MGGKLANIDSHREVIEQRMPPFAHDGIAREAYALDQSPPCLVKAYGRYQDVKVRIEIQMAAEGVTDHQDYDPRAVLLLGPVLQNSRADCGEIVEQVPILLKDGPENIWHSESNACKCNVRKHGCHFTLPGERRALAAA